MNYVSHSFLNLFSNSLKFTSHPPVIKIWGKESDGAMTICFEDNGIGLAICKRIMDIHHGTIVVSGSPGEGCTFIIELPAAQKR